MNGYEKYLEEKRKEKEMEKMYWRRVKFYQKADCFIGDLYPIAGRLLVFLFRPVKEDEWTVEATLEEMIEFLGCTEDELDTVIKRYIRRGFIEPAGFNRWVVYY